MGMAGRWTEDMQKAYDAIKSIRSRYGEEDTIPSDELKEVAKLAVVFQPIKPYMFTIENYPINLTEKLKVPVQHKYAEAVHCFHFCVIEQPSKQVSLRCINPSRCKFLVGHTIVTGCCQSRSPDSWCW